MKKLALLALLIPLTASAEHLVEGASDTWDCGQDPLVSINTTAGGKYTLTGTCDVVNINGDGHTLTIDVADVINLNGSKQVITINELATINIVGNDNKITIKNKGAQANIVGKNNKVAKPPRKKK